LWSAPGASERSDHGHTSESYSAASLGPLLCVVVGGGGDRASYRGRIYESTRGWSGAWLDESVVESKHNGRGPVA